MRNILTYIAVMLLYAVNMTAQPDSLYKQAAEAYSQGQFEESFDLYRQIKKSGYEAADLYYNMGNAAFRSNKLGYAILYYEKALKLDPRHDDARSNLDYVSMYREDQLETVPVFFLKSWITALFNLFPLKSWSILSVLLFVIILSGILIYLFSRRLPLKKTGFSLALIAVLLFIISLSASINRHRQIVHPDAAVIISPSVVVKSSPSRSGTDLFILHEGTRATTDDKVGEWVEIRISDGRVGWIPAGSIEMI